MQELAKTEAAIAAPRSPLQAIIANPEALSKLPIDTLEKLYALHERDTDRSAAMEFASAFNRVQSGMSAVDRNGTGAHGIKYALLDDVLDMLHPLLMADGFSYSFSQLPGDNPPNIKFTMLLRHTCGHTERHYLELPPDGGGARGAANKNAIQAIISSASYAERTLMAKVFGIQTCDDTDGREVVDPVSEEQAQDIQSLLDQLPAATQERVKAYWAEKGIRSVQQHEAAKYGAIVRYLEGKLG